MVFLLAAIEANLFNETLGDWMLAPSEIIVYYIDLYSSDDDQEQRLQ